MDVNEPVGHGWIYGTEKIWGWLGFDFENVPDETKDTRDTKDIGYPCADVFTLYRAQ